MRNRFRPTYTLFAAFALGTLAHAGALKPFEDTYSLKPTMKVGDVLKLKVAGELDLGGQSIQYKALVTSKVLTSDDKSYSVEQLQSDVNIVVGGQDMGNAGQEPQPVTFTYDNRGVITGIKATDDRMTGADAYRASALETFYVPENPVKMGDSWTYKSDKVENKWNALQIDYKLVAAEKVGSTDTLKIEFKAKETSGTAGQEGTVWLDAKDFTLVKREAKYTQFPIPGAPAPIDGKMTFTRVQ